MRVVKGLRQRQLKPYAPGHHIAASKSQWGQPVIDTTNRRASKEVEILDLDVWPEEVSLRVKWVPIPLDEREATAQSIVPDYAYQTCKFYNPKACDQVELAQSSAFEGIELIYQGLGSFEMNQVLHPMTGNAFGPYVIELSEPENVVYTKTFITQKNQDLVS